MPVINVEDLTDKDKAVMEVNQLKLEVKLERWLVSSPHCGDLCAQYAFLIISKSKYQTASIYLVKLITSQRLFKTEIRFLSAAFRHLNAVRKSRTIFRL